MNTNDWIKKNSVLVGVIVVVLLIFVFFWWNGSSTNMETSINKAWVEAPIAAPNPVPAPAPAATAAIIEWCAQINGLQGGHLPHLLNMGTNTPGGGQNWFSSRNATGAEEAGILADGTYFIKKSVADQAAAVLGTSIVTFQVKTSENTWSQPKPGTLGTVAGEPAWIFK